jgi:hypothetical protein
MLDELKKAVEMFAYLAAAGFFVFKWTSGYMSTNLSIEIVCTRKESTPDTDLLGVVVILSKGDRGSLHIFDVGIRVDEEEVDVRDQMEPYSVAREEITSEKRRRIIWSSKDNHYYPFLQAGEKTQVALGCEVARKKVSRIDVVVVGRRN